MSTFIKNTIKAMAKQAAAIQKEEALLPFAANKAILTAAIDAGYAELDWMRAGIRAEEIKELAKEEAAEAAKAAEKKAADDARHAEAEYAKATKATQAKMAKVMAKAKPVARTTKKVRKAKKTMPKNVTFTFKPVAIAGSIRELTEDERKALRLHQGKMLANAAITSSNRKTRRAAKNNAPSTPIEAIKETITSKVENLDAVEAEIRHNNKAIRKAIRQLTRKVMSISEKAELNMVITEANLTNEALWQEACALRANLTAERAEAKILSDNADDARRAQAWAKTIAKVDERLAKRAEAAKEAAATKQALQEAYEADAAELNEKLLEDFSVMLDAIKDAKSIASASNIFNEIVEKAKALRDARNDEPVKIIREVMRDVANRVINLGKKALREKQDGYTKGARYWARQYTVAQLLPKKEADLWKAIPKAETGYDLAKAINSLKVYALAHQTAKFEAPDETPLPTWGNLSESEMSRGLGTAANSRQHAINDIKFDLMFPNIHFVPWNKAGDKMSWDQFQALLEELRICQNIYMTRAKAFGFILEDGTTAIPVILSSGQGKKGESYLIDAKTFLANRKLFKLAGLTDRVDSPLGDDGVRLWERIYTMGFNLAKMAQIEALVSSSSVSMESIHGFTFHARDMLIVDDIEVTIPAQHKLIKVDGGKYVVKGHNEIKVKVTDGGCITFDERLYGMMAQMRLFIGGKGTVQYFDVLKRCKKMGYSLKIKAFDGTIHDVVKEGIKLIAPKSVIKPSVFFKTMEEYWRICEEAPAEYGFNECHIMAFSEEHPKQKTFTRQSIQPLMGLSIEDMDAMAQPQYDAIHALATEEGARKAVTSGDTGFAKVMSALDNGFMLPVAQAALVDKHDQMLRDLACGKIGKGYMGMSTYDPAAAVDVWFGHKDPNDPSIGVLKAGEIAFRPCRKYSKVLAVRYPVSGINKEQVCRIRDWADIGHNGIVFSFHDAIVMLADGDHDGDHFLLITNKEAIREAERLMAKFGPITTQAMATSERAWPQINWENGFAIAQVVAETCVFMKLNNKIGPDSDEITKVFDRYPNEDEAIEHILPRTKKAQDDVDSTKTYAPSVGLSYDEQQVAKGLMPFSDIFMGKEFEVVDTEYGFKVKRLVQFYNWEYFIGENHMVSTKATGLVSKWAAHVMFADPKEDIANTELVARADLPWVYRPDYKVGGCDISVMELPTTDPLGMYLLRVGLTDKEKRALIDIGTASVSYSDYIEKKIKNGTISYSDLATYLFRVMASKVDELNDRLDLNDPSDCAEKEAAVRTVKEKIRDLLIYFVRPRANGVARNFSKEEKAIIAANNLCRDFFGTGKLAATAKIASRTPELIAGNSYRGIFLQQRNVCECFADEIVQIIETNKSRVTEEINVKTAY